MVVREEMSSQSKPEYQEPHSEHVSHCPNCYKDTIERMNKTSDYMCADCHLPLGNEEFVKKLESCPNCGGKAPVKVQR